MKAFAFIFLLTLAGCAAAEGTEDATQGRPAALGVNTCSSGGGACRKGCRVGEEVSDTLECGHDQACCVPAQGAQFFENCSTRRGTCRASQCEANEELDASLICGIAGVCCVPP